MSFITEHSPIQTTGQIENLTLLKLKIWWKTLTVDQKQALCKIDSSNILSGLVNVANKAIYLCRMNQAYKKKDLMSKTTTKAQNGEIQSQIIEFNLIGKEIVENGWEDLLSCFYISIAQGQKPKEGDSKEDVSQDQTSMSYIGVKSEKLEFVLDRMWNCVPGFARGDKPVYREQTLLELFPSILNYSSQINVSTLNLKPDLRVLFENLIAFSIMLEHQIYLGYFKSSTSYKEQKEMTQAVADKFNCLSTQLGLEEGKSITPLMVKTVSQLERESDQQRTKKPDALKISGRLDIEKPCQSLASKTALDQTSCSSHQDKSASSSSTDSIRQFYEERVSAYDGFFMDDLVVEFELADNLLTNDAFLDADEKEQQEVMVQEEKRFAKVEQEEVQEDQDQSSDDEGSLGQSSNDSFYEQPSSRMNDIPRFPFYSGQHHNTNVEYYSSYFPQQHSPAPPHNFGMPMAPQFNQPNEYMVANFDRFSPVYQGKDNSFSDNDVYAQRKKSYESQSSQNSDRDYFPAGQFNSQFSKGNLVDNKAKRHYARPQLPPRLQKKKEQMLRN